MLSISSAKSLTQLVVPLYTANILPVNSRRFRSNNQHANNSKRSWKTIAAIGVTTAAIYGYNQYGDQIVTDASLDSNQKVIVGKLHQVCSDVIVAPSKQKAYVTGQRIGKGRALAICKPKSLQEAIDVLQVCVDNDIAIVPQGANTGLTGGSVPRDNIDRPVVVINMRALNRVTSIGSGDSTKMVCLPGAGILDVSNKAEECNRESHSILGSVFLNPSVAAGVAFGSGGTQIRKGPAYTERVVYAKVNSDGKVEIVNDTGIKANSTAELFRKLETGDIAEDDIDWNAKAKFWDADYPSRVSKLNDSVSRFNSQSDSPSLASRCEGKVMILGTIHQTFPKPVQKEVYWVSSNSFDAICDLRTKVALGDSTGKTLPASCEYMNKDSVDITLSHGASACAIIAIGGMKNIGRLYKIQAIADKFMPIGFSDRIVQSMGIIVPKSFILPKSVIPQLNMAHHALIDMSDFGQGELDALKDRFNKLLSTHGEVLRAVKLEGNDIAKSSIFRFTIAAAFKIYCLLKKKPGVSLDYALRKNSVEGFPDVPAPVHKRAVYGHFGCNVIHDDIIFENGVDPHTMKYEIKKLVEKDGGVLPAEHGHGTEYCGTRDFQEKLKRTDPLNVMNPGVAGTSPLKNYA